MKLNAYIYAHKPNDHAYESNIYSHYAVLRLPGSKEPALPRGGLCGGHSGRSAFFTSAAKPTLLLLITVAAYASTIN